jgi:hypothetical protein
MLPTLLPTPVGSKKQRLNSAYALLPMLPTREALGRTYMCARSDAFADHLVPERFLLTPCHSTPSKRPSSGMRARVDRHVDTPGMNRFPKQGASAGRNSAWPMPPLVDVADVNPSLLVDHRRCGSRWITTPRTKKRRERRVSRWGTTSSVSWLVCTATRFRTTSSSGSKRPLVSGCTSRSCRSAPDRKHPRQTKTPLELAGRRGGPRDSGSEPEWSYARLYPLGSGVAITSAVSCPGVVPLGDP